MGTVPASPEWTRVGVRWRCLDTHSAVTRNSVRPDRAALTVCYTLHSPPRRRTPCHPRRRNRLSTRARTFGPPRRTVWHRLGTRSPPAPGASLGGEGLPQPGSQQESHFTHHEGTPARHLHSGGQVGGSYGQAPRGPVHRPCAPQSASSVSPGCSASPRGCQAAPPPIHSLLQAASPTSVQHHPPNTHPQNRSATSPNSSEPTS